MKKLLSVILSLIFTGALLAGTIAFSSNDITVELDGKTIEFDVNPQIIDGHTMVPLRKIFEEIGAAVKWDNDTQTVSARKNSKTITLVIDSAEMQIDKGKTDDEGNQITQTVTLEVPAQIVSGRTLVPVRAISESFGLNVDWDEDNQKVIITSADDGDDSWKENIGSINLTDLTFEGNGIEITNNQITITAGGDFTLTGTLADGNITVSTKEKVKLRLSGASVTSSENPCIFVEEADKAYITISDNTENYLVSENSENGAIYSKENLEIKGGGNLNIESLAGHGIKASDNLNIENGTVTINAVSDGIHINDTFNMTGGTVNITAIGDGIDCESIVNISGGTINIETNGVPIETAQTTTDTAQQTQRRGMPEETADVEFEKSSKGVNAEWMMCISGGEININSASHAIHCQDEIEINGGIFNLSSKYDKGISAHGNLTINGSETTIDITKSTEGIESKNVMTINDGVIKVVSTDDSLNATGGNSGTMEPGGNFGENGNHVPSADFKRDERVPSDSLIQENEENQTQQNIRPGRVGNNGLGNMEPNFEAPENGEFIPPDGTKPQMDEGTMPEGFMGGNGRNMKDCLVINGGYIELYAGDDCLDSNGNLIINGGTIKATNSNGSFSGVTGIIDPDGQTTISENANLIFASGSGNERSLSLTQNTIIVYCEQTHGANEEITVSDTSGNIVCEYTPTGNYKAVLIASNSLKTGEKYLITVGDETFETEISGQNTVIGTQSTANQGFGRGQIMR